VYSCFLPANTVTTSFAATSTYLGVTATMGAAIDGITMGSPVTTLQGIGSLQQLSLQTKMSSISPPYLTHNMGETYLTPYYPGYMATVAKFMNNTMQIIEVSISSYSNLATLPTNASLLEIQIRACNMASVNGAPILLISPWMKLFSTTPYTFTLPPSPNPTAPTPTIFGFFILLRYTGGTTQLGTNINAFISISETPVAAGGALVGGGPAAPRIVDVIASPKPKLRKTSIRVKRAKKQTAKYKR
jgi:hypothetical protein